MNGEMYLLDERGCINFNVPCLACQYNQRGLPLEGVCPECGMATRLALRGNALGHANPQWMSTLASGARMVFVTSIVAVGVFLSMCFIGTLFPVLVATWVTPVMMGVMTFGFWKWTVPEPSPLTVEPRISARVVARWGHVMALASLVLTLTTNGEGRMAVMLFFVMCMMMFVATLATLTYLRGLAMRIPAPALARQLKMLMWGITGTITLAMGAFMMMSLFTLIALATVICGTGIGFGSRHAFACPVNVAMLVLTIWYLLMLAIWRGRFSREAERARRHAEHRAGSGA